MVSRPHQHVQEMALYKPDPPHKHSGIHPLGDPGPPPRSVTGFAHGMADCLPDDLRLLFQPLKDGEILEQNRYPVADHLHSRYNALWCQRQHGQRKLVLGTAWELPRNWTFGRWCHLEHSGRPHFLCCRINILTQVYHIGPSPCYEITSSLNDTGSFKNWYAL